ncbi:MAG: manganese efflux pump [Bacteroidales bacterium]|nr:manganese efflux pump [Candidatus Colimorpha onthohippi]
MFQDFLLALALSVDSLVVSTTCALKTHMGLRRSFLLATTFALFQGGFPLLGALLGDACSQIIESADHWIAFGLLLLVGGKMLWDAFRISDNAKPLDLSRYWVICTLAVATSIDAFVVGIGLGLQQSVVESLLTAVIIMLITFVASITGVMLGGRKIPIPEKTATILAGLVLIGLGTHTLLTHLVG